ncbi:MAG TPA: DnaJ domain-containing protein [Polyangia bacterium]|nr:DnaJ domain-containing protein [Polyangia bacterium]
MAAAFHEGSDDLYAVLGVERTAAAGEIRRAYRRLALRLHPDRAGVASTERFLRVAEAYRVLSDAAARASYDAVTAPARLPVAAAVVSANALHVIARLAAPLEALLARGIARRRADGVVEVSLLPDEARTGGHAAIGVPLRVPCPTCGGCAQPGQLWCRRCEFAGAIDDVVTVTLAIPAGVPDGTTFSVPLDDVHGASTMRVCLRAPRAAKW